MCPHKKNKLKLRKFEKMTSANLQVHCSVVIQSTSEPFLIKFGDIIIDVFLRQPRGQHDLSMGRTTKSHFFRNAKWTWSARSQKIHYYPRRASTSKLLFCLSGFLQQKIACPLRQCTNNKNQIPLSELLEAE